MATPEFQQTLGKVAGFTGTALHTGEKVTLKLHPAPVDHGIKFKRKDLQDEPTVDARIGNLKTVERSTTIGEGSVRVHTVEHVLAALSAMGVDNAIVEMDANEPPIGDGSAQPYVDLIKKAGVTAQEEPRKFFDVREPMHVEAKTGALLVLLPDDKFRISCTQAGPNNQFTQFLSLEVTPSIFEREIAPARTFVYYEDVEPLMDKNLIKGGSLENAIVVRGEAVLKQGTVAFPRRIRPSQNPRYYRRSRARRAAYPRSRGGSEARTFCECGIGSRARSRADAEKRDEHAACDPNRRFRSGHWRSDEDPSAPLPFFDG